MKLVQNGKLTIPLYHGTSSHFLASIAEHGLGAQNPVHDLKVIPFLKHAYEISDQLFGENADSPWLICRSSVEKIINQEISQGGFSFQHGGVYLTPSCLTAVRYAVANPLGSEILSTAVKLYRSVIEQEPKYASDAKFKKSPLLKLLDQRAFPVLIKALQVNVSHLKGEAGQDAEDIIERLGKMLAHIGVEHLDTLGQQSNFKLGKPLPPTQVKSYKIIIVAEDPISPKYELYEL